MGNCLGGGNTAPQGGNKSVVVDDKKTTVTTPTGPKQKEVKVVFLGSGETGKSTMFRQIRFLLGQSFSVDEVKACKLAIYENILTATRDGVKAMLKMKLNFTKEESGAHAKEVLEALGEDTILEFENNYKNLYESLIHLWEDPVLAQLMTDRNFYFYDGAQHFCKLENLKRIVPGSDYVPSYEDTLYSRIKTIGVVEVKFEFEETKFTVTDVGGQRTERKKWNSVLENTTGILYVASLAEYDQNCYEDGLTNRMLESIELFDQSINGNLLKNATVILLLNKNDLFLEKIQKKDLATLFPEYTGGCDANNASQFIIDKYRSVNKFAKDRLHIFTTSAVNKDDFIKTFDDVKKILATKAK
jgi:guanine nucleotide-binding protein G(i) subunit alpha